MLYLTGVGRQFKIEIRNVTLWMYNIDYQKNSKYCTIIFIVFLGMKIVQIKCSVEIAQTILIPTEIWIQDKWFPNKIKRRTQTKNRSWVNYPVLRDQAFIRFQARTWCKKTVSSVFSLDVFIFYVFHSLKLWQLFLKFD